MNKKPLPRKLSLDPHTLRNLSADQLGRVEGGAIGSFVYCSSACGSGVPGCSAKCASEAHLTCR